MVYRIANPPDAMIAWCIQLYLSHLRRRVPKPAPGRLFMSMLNEPHSFPRLLLP